MWVGWMGLPAGQRGGMAGWTRGVRERGWRVICLNITAHIATCGIRLSPSLLLSHADTHAHISLPSAACAFCTDTNSIITKKKKQEKDMKHIYAGFPAHPHCVHQYIPKHTHRRTSLLNLWPGRMEPVCSKAASRQGQGLGFLQGHMCV